MTKIRKCNHMDKEKLMKYLNNKPIYHTFILSDIEQYGFDNEFQSVYIQEDGEVIQGVFLRYFNNFIVAGDAEVLAYNEITELVDNKVSTIMGNAAIVNGITDKIDRKADFVYNNLYTHEDPVNIDENVTCHIAELKDVDRIYEFLMTFPEFKQLYSEKQMLENRLKNGEGIHIYIEENGKLIAHGNSAASAEKTCMMGGICVAEPYRNKGYAKKILLTLCAHILEEGKIPCIFASAEKDYSCFKETGFQVYGLWGVAQLEQKVN